MNAKNEIKNVKVRKTKACESLFNIFLFVFRFRTFVLVSFFAFINRKLTAC
jgi:hypothetical protein